MKTPINGHRLIGLHFFNEYFTAFDFVCIYFYMDYLVILSDEYGAKILYDGITFMAEVGCIADGGQACVC